MDSTDKLQVFQLLQLIFLVVVLDSSLLIAGQTNSSQSGTNLLEISNATQSDDTVRVDPLDNFNKYRGGYDITNKNYWSSTVFTGIYGYAISVLWLLAGLVLGGILLSKSYCCKTQNLKKKSPCHKQCYLWPILLAIFFTILAIIVTGLVLGGNQKFDSRAKTVVDIIIDTADNASVTIYNTTGALKEIRDNLDSSNVSTSGDQASSFLTSTSQTLDDQANDIARQARKNRRLIDKGLKIVYIITTVVISLNLIALIALSVCGTLRLKRALNWLIVLCWILTALCWFFFGLYFFLGEFSSDTCTALENFQINPYNNSLSEILPCDELLEAKSSLTDVGEGIYNIVNQVNENITFVQVCNPFSGPPEYEYEAGNCPTNTIQIEDIPTILEPLTCSGSNNNVTCNAGEFIPMNDFRTMQSYTTSLQNLLDAYPGMESLVECQSVKDAFSEILTKHCKPLKKYVRMVWGSLLFLSLNMVFLVSIWTALARHEQEKHFSDHSVKPHSSSAANEIESEEIKVVQDSSKNSLV